LVSIYCLEILLLGVQNFQFDTRTRLQVIEDLRARGIESVPAVSPVALWDEQQDGQAKSVIQINGSEVLPLGGIARKLTVMCNESGEWITYRSDEHGFNNPEGIWQGRELRVAAVGDSFAFGACVPADKNFMALIRKTYPATLNLGMNGAGPLVELAAMKEFLPLFRPKVTLWFYLELNDQLDLIHEKRSPLLMRYLRENFDQGLITRQAEIDRALTQFVEARKELAEDGKIRARLTDVIAFIKLSTVRRKLGLIHGTSRSVPSFRPDELPSGLFREILQNARALVKSWSGTLYFVYLPAWYRYASPDSVDDNREAVLALARGLGLAVIDIHETFEAHGDPLRFFPFRQVGHYNEDGNRVVADTVLRRISGGPVH
jgi:hypothetical protein